MILFTQCLRTTFFANTEDLWNLASRGSIQSWLGLQVPGLWTSSGRGSVLWPPRKATALQQNGSSVLEWPSGMVQNSKTSNSLGGSCTRHHKTYRLSFTPKRIRSPVRHKSVGWGFTAAPWKVVLAGEERILHNFTLDGLLEGIQWFSWRILNSWIDIPEVADCRFHITLSRSSARMTWMIWSTGFARLRRKKGCFLSCSPWDDLRKIRKGDHKDLRKTNIHASPTSPWLSNAFYIFLLW